LIGNGAFRERDGAAQSAVVALRAIQTTFLALRFLTALASIVIASSLARSSVVFLQVGRSAQTMS
jgi:hypothetical protein